MNASSNYLELINLSSSAPDIDHEQSKYKAQCLIEAVKSGIVGLQEKSAQGGTLNEFEIVGLTEILRMASEIIESL